MRYAESNRRSVLSGVNSVTFFNPPMFNQKHTLYRILIHANHESQPHPRASVMPNPLLESHKKIAGDISTSAWLPKKLTKCPKHLAEQDAGRVCRKNPQKVKMKPGNSVHTPCRVSQRWPSTKNAIVWELRNAVMRGRRLPGYYSVQVDLKTPRDPVRGRRAN